MLEGTQPSPEVAKAAQYRYKILRIGARQIVELFNSIYNYTCLEVSVFKNMPRDVQVHGVNYNSAFRCFEILLHHPSFEEIPDCSEIPKVEVSFEMVQLKRDPEYTNTMIIPAEHCSLMESPTPSMIGKARVTENLDDIECLLHSLWSNAVGKEGYDKKKWIRLEREIINLQRLANK